ncbi:hypothetical protein FAI40_10015 [Acetobacteraceae bacterium]|nr:hypothetical protein FAI40_10015 [Acetobacteraceae bacterium]
MDTLGLSSFRELTSDNSQQTKINELIRAKLAYQAPQLPVKVVAVNITKNGDGSPADVGTVDVQPMVSMQDAAGQTVEHGIIYGVPYFRQQAGKSALVIDPQKDDIGFIAIAGRDIQNVLSSKDVSAPASYRINHFNDAVYIPSMLCSAPEQYIFATDKGWRIHASDNNQIQLDVKDSKFTLTSKNAVITCDVEIQGNLTCKKDLTVQGKITCSGEIQADGDIISGSISLQKHVHSNGNMGANTGEAIG